MSPSKATNSPSSRNRPVCPTDQMQTITREMNFSECTFIFPPETPGTNVRMRIFTPGEELPMAGHPTIGSTFALAKEGVIAPGQAGFVFGLNVGPTPVSLEWKGTALDFAWMTQKNPEFGGEIADRAGFARALGLDTKRSRGRPAATRCPAARRSCSPRSRRGRPSTASSST